MGWVEDAMMRQQAGSILGSGPSAGLLGAIQNRGAMTNTAPGLAAGLLGAIQNRGAMTNTAPLTPAERQAQMPQALDPGEIDFAGGQPQPILGSGQFQLDLPKIPGGASVKPIQEARKNLQDMPGKIQASGQKSMQEIGDAAEAMKGAEQKLADAQARSSAEQAGIMKTGLDARNRLIMNEQAKVDTAKLNVDNKMKTFEQAKLDLASAKIDPQRRFSGGAKIVAAIGVALGAAAQSLRGGPNTALDIIQSEIDRDIEAQQMEMQKKKNVAGLALSEVGVARQAFQDAESQKLAAQNAHWEGVKLQMGQKAMEHQSPVVQANAAKNMATIDAKMAQNTEQIRRNQMAMELSAGQAELGAAQAEVGARQKNVQLGQQKAGMEAKMRAAAAKEIVQSNVPPTLALVDPNYKPDGKDKESAQKQSSAYGKAVTEIDKLIAWRAKHGAETLDREAVRVGKTMMNRAKSVMRDLDGTGARLEEAELEMMGLEFDVDEIGFVMSQLKTLKNSITDKTIQGMKPYGYTLRSQAARKRGKKISK